MDEDLPGCSNGRSGQSTIARLLLANDMTRQEQQDTSMHDDCIREVPPMSVVEVDSQEKLSILGYESGRGNLLPLELPEDRSSPENVHMSSPAGIFGARLYRCRFCNFSTMKYTQLQLHMPKHGGVKALKCSLCDYSTNDKSNFRRHKRLHLRINPVNVLKCDKCPYTTILPRKIREHYCQEHSYTGQTFGETRFSFQHIGVDQNSSSGNPLGVSTLHTLLTTVQSPNLQFRNSGTQPVNNCFGQYNHYESLGRQTTTDGHLASNYLRSIVSSIMSSPPPPRVPATSTITSSSYYTSSAESSISPTFTPTTVHASSLCADTEPDVKVKIEPFQCDEVSDISSSTTNIPLRLHTPEFPRYSEPQTTHSRSLEIIDDPGPFERSAEPAQAVDVARTVNAAESSTARFDQRLNHQNLGSGVYVKTEMSSIGIQCFIPSIKSENTSLGQDAVDRTCWRSQLKERAVQCELLPSRRLTSRSLSAASESEGSEHHSLTASDSKCTYCGVTFEDEVLFSIHIGCHSHTDPFVCNVCGKQCCNKYGFYSHIMRGHQY